MPHTGAWRIKGVWHYGLTNDPYFFSFKPDAAPSKVSPANTAQTGQQHADVATDSLFVPPPRNVVNFFAAMQQGGQQFHQAMQTLLNLGEHLPAQVYINTIQNSTAEQEQQGDNLDTIGVLVGDGVWLK